jgi:hypothetical protein
MGSNAIHNQEGPRSFEEANPHLEQGKHRSISLLLGFSLSNPLLYVHACCDRTTSEGVRHQDQLERFSVKQEHNQHIIVHYHIIH